MALSRIWRAFKPYIPVSALPLFVVTCIYLDMQRTKRYKKQKEIESLGLRREFDKKINL